MFNEFSKLYFLFNGFSFVSDNISSFFLRNNKKYATIFSHINISIICWITSLSLPQHQKNIGYKTNKILYGLHGLHQRKKNNREHLNFFLLQWHRLFHFIAIVIHWPLIIIEKIDKRIYAWESIEANRLIKD